MLHKNPHQSRRGQDSVEKSPPGRTKTCQFEIDSNTQKLVRKGGFRYFSSRASRREWAKGLTNSLHSDYENKCVSYFEIRRKSRGAVQFWEGLKPFSKSGTHLSQQEEIRKFISMSPRWSRGKRTRMKTILSFSSNRRRDPWELLCRVKTWATRKKGKSLHLT